MRRAMNTGIKIRELAALGAKHRVEQIQEELYAMHREFPEIFPSGVPVITPLQRRPISNKAKAAKDLVHKAKKLATKRGRKKQVIQPLDPNADLVTAPEAAKIIGIAEPSLYTVIKKGKLAVYSTNEKGWARLLRSDVEAFAANYNKRQPEAEAVSA